MVNIWQFGEEYIDSENGRKATPKEILAFKAKHKKLKEQQLKIEEKRLIDLKNWHKKYDIAMRKFFKGKMGQNCCEWVNDNDELCYKLATELFDNIDCLPKIKELFPDIWKQALEYYKNGSHDT